LLDLVDGILSRQEIVWQAAWSDGFGVEMADIWSTQQVVTLQVSGQQDRRLLATVNDENGRVATGPIPVRPNEPVNFGRLPEGGYRVIVGGSTPAGPLPVSKPFLVLDPDAKA